MASAIYVGRSLLGEFQDIKGETRMAITTHESADVGVCLTNRLSSGKHSAAPLQGYALRIICRKCRGKRGRA